MRNLISFEVLRTVNGNVEVFCIPSEGTTFYMTEESFKENYKHYTSELNDAVYALKVKEDEENSIIWDGKQEVTDLTKEVVDGEDACRVALTNITWYTHQRDKEYLKELTAENTLEGRLEVAQLYNKDAFYFEDEVVRVEDYQTTSYTVTDTENDGIILFESKSIKECAKFIGVAGSTIYRNKQSEGYYKVGKYEVTQIVTIRTKDGEF